MDGIIFRNYFEGVIVFVFDFNTKKCVGYGCHWTWSLHIDTHVNKEIKEKRVNWCQIFHIYSTIGNTEHVSYPKRSVSA